MLASLIRLRQSQSTNKSYNCDQGDMREENNQSPPLCRFSLLFRSCLVPPAHRNKVHFHTSSNTKQGTALNPNQTAVSHAVTVATVASLMQNTFCHITGGFSFSCSSMRHAQTWPTLSHSKSCADLSSGSMNKAAECVGSTARGHSSDRYHTNPSKAVLHHLRQENCIRVARLPP